MESRSPRSGKSLRKHIKSAVLAERALKAQSENFRLNADKLDTCKKIKQCADDFVVSKNTGPVFVDVGALMEGNRERQGQQPRRQRKQGQGHARRQGQGRTTARRGAKVRRCHNQCALKATAVHVRKWVHKSKGLWQRRRGQHWNKVHAVEGKGEQPTSTEVANSTALPQDRREDRNRPKVHRRGGRHHPLDRFKHSDRPVQTCHGAKCPVLLRMARFSLWKMADALFWTAGLVKVWCSHTFQKINH